MLKLATTLLLAMLYANTVDAQSAKPHIVFIMADDLGWNDVGYHGHGEINTPNIDELADDGVRLEHYYVGPTCGPTRAQFLSGKYTIHLGLHGSNLHTCTHEALPTNYSTIADHLRTEGYATHLIGKWHAGYYTPDHLPTSRGFDTFRGFLLSHSDHYTHETPYNDVEYLDFHNNTTPYPEANGTYSTNAFTDRAKELITAHNPDEPMFMYLSYQAPHTPLQVPSSFLSEYDEIPIDDRKYTAAMITAMDDGIGQVVQSLKDAGIYDNTVIIFSSDNGGAAGKGSSFPLRGSKGTYFEGGIRAVGFVSSELIPERHRNRTMTDLIHVTDWLPTMVNIAGGSSRDFDIDGINQWNTIKRSQPSRRSEILHIIMEEVDPSARKNAPFDDSITAAMSDGNYKILTGVQSGFVHLPNPSDNYTAWADSIGGNPKSRTTKLYHIFDDPTELDDLSEIETTIRDEMLAKLKQYQRTMHTRISDAIDSNCDPGLRSTGAWGPYAELEEAI